MGFSPQDFNDPLTLFEHRTRKVRVSIQTLENDLRNVKSPLSQAIIEKELNDMIDDYVERKSVLNRERSND